MNQLPASIIRTEITEHIKFLDGHSYLDRIAISEKEIRDYKRIDKRYRKS